LFDSLRSNWFARLAMMMGDRVHLKDEDFITIVHSESTNRLMQELARRDNLHKRLNDRRQQLSALLLTVQQEIISVRDAVSGSLVAFFRLM
jgi:hypothetical protein